MGIIIVILLVVIIVALIVGICSICSALEWIVEAIDDWYDDPKDYFKEESERMAKEYAETFEACQKLTSLLEEEELDVSKIREETESRAYALLISNAEHAVNTCTVKLTDTLERIKERQKTLNEHIAQGRFTEATYVKRQLRELNEQRKFCEGSLAEAKKRLEQVLHPEYAPSEEELQIPEWFDAK